MPEIGAGDRITLRVPGSLDVSAVAGVRESIAALRAAGCERLVVDLQRVDFMDSHGLRLLIDTDREARDDGWSFAITAGGSPVERLLALTGLTRHFRRA